MALLPEDYTLAQLRTFIRTKLGGSVWRLEGMGLDQADTIDQAISQALHAYSRRCPRPLFTTIRTMTTSTVYKIPPIFKPECGILGSGATLEALLDAGDEPFTGQATHPTTHVSRRQGVEETIYSVWRVDFVYPSLVVSPFMASLVGVAPVLNLEGQDFDMFLTWRKTFQRVTGIEPKWMWDAENKVLRIYNAVHNSIAGVFMYAPRSFDQIKLVHKDWIRRASVAYAKEILGENRSKFKGTLPGPGGKDIQLNGDDLKKEAQEALEKLNDELFKFQTKGVPQFD